MPDSPKDAGRSSRRVTGRTHTAEELADLWPLRLGGPRVLLALVVPVYLGTLITYAVLGLRSDAAVLAGVAGVTVTAVMLVVCTLVAGDFQNPVVWLRQYWQRNVRGYAVAYWLDDQGQLVGMAGLRLPALDRSKSEHSPTIYLPLGGWMHRPRFADCLNDLHSSYGVRVRWPWFQPIPDKVWMTDHDGGRVKLWISDALTLWGVHARYGNVELHELFARLLCDLQYAQRGRADVLALLLEVYDRIVATKRFIRSTQAQAIADDLRRRLHELLPHDHPRCAEFAKRPTAKAAPSAAST